jgi:threonine dehydratase
VLALQQIRAAAERARPHVLRTPLIPVDGALLKLECLQPTGSFKVRGFFAAALALSPDRLQRGLITVSAGNAAAACAYVAKRLAVPCRVVMFDNAPSTKVEGVKRWGGTIVSMPRDDVLHWMATEGWKNDPEHFIHPFPMGGSVQIRQAGGCQARDHRRRHGRPGRASHDRALEGVCRPLCHRAGRETADRHP